MGPGGRRVRAGARAERTGPGRGLLGRAKSGRCRAGWAAGAGEETGRREGWAAGCSWAKKKEGRAGSLGWVSGVWFGFLGLDYGFLSFLFLFLLLFLFLIQTKFELKYNFEFKPHSNN